MENKTFYNHVYDIFRYNYELRELGSRNDSLFDFYPTRTIGANNVLRYHIQELLNIFPEYLKDTIKTYLIYSSSHHI